MTTAEIVTPPETMLVPIGHSSPAVFTCRVRGSSLFFRFNDTLYNSNTLRALNARGISIDFVSSANGIITETATVQVSEANNNTAVECIATSPGETAVSSEPALLLIAGIVKYNS